MGSRPRRYTLSVDFPGDHGTLTYDQVLAADRRASRPSEKDEFVYLPGGITYWHSLRPDGPHTYGCSLPVRDRTMPDDGWVHEQPCGCPFCHRDAAGG